MTNPTEAAQAEAIRARLHDKLTAAVQETAARFQALSPDQWQTVIYADSGWTAVDLLRHLIAAESGMGQLIANICAGGSGSSADFDLDRWNARQVAKQQDKTPAELLAALAETHRGTVARLAAIAPDEWERRGRHALVGDIAVKGLFKLIAEHQKMHLADLDAALGR